MNCALILLSVLTTGIRFLSTQDLVIPGNNGLKDQQMVIKWAHENINLFNSDPQEIQFWDKAQVQPGYVRIILPNGPIFGKSTKSYSEKVYYAFQKIPYAAPPVGELRFKPPVPPNDWTELLNATYLDAICYQISTDLPEETEDCLYINVFTPNLENSSYPVLLYIYGGGFAEGHSMQYRRGPEYLIDYDIIIVTFNYRLGPLGFLSTGDTTVPGNNGLKDQQLAIKWTYDNIKLFGGDPSKITIVGESAGGVSVSYQLLNKNVEGLFRGAIMESGTAINPWSVQRDARDRAFAFGSVLDSSFKDANDSESLLDYLLTVSAKDLDNASTIITGWGPVMEVEHEDSLITDKMYVLIKSGNFSKVTILMGINSEERLSEAADLNSVKAQAEQYDNNLDSLVPEDMRITNIDNLKQFGQIIRQIYVGDKKFVGDIASVVRFHSDNIFTRAIIKCAELKSNFTDVFFYQFSYDGEMGNVTISIEGAEHVAHAEELRYIWRTTRDGYDNSDLSKFPAEDAITQRRMLTMWTNFVKYLNPTPEELDILQNVTWPTTTSAFYYLNIDENLEVKEQPKEQTYKGWTQLYGLLNYDDFDTY